MSQLRSVASATRAVASILWFALSLGCGQGSGGGGGGGMPGTEADAHGSGEAASCTPPGSACGAATLCCQGPCSVVTGQTQATCQ
jgi:hypothetical protein